MRKGKILPCLLIVSLFVSMFAGNIYVVAEENGDYRYTVNEGTSTCTITSYKGPGGTITIPAALDGYTVTAIGESAFINCTSLAGASIPNSVTSIGAGAFCGCSALIGIAIPNKVASVNEGTFFGCSSLSSIEIPNSVTSIEEAAFAECTSMAAITIPDSVTAIGRGAFSRCTALISVEIPNKVTLIGEDVFYGCSKLSSVTIPGSVTSIGAGAFAKCSALTCISVDAGNTHFNIRDGALFDIDKSELICYPAKLTGNTFSIPNGVASIGYQAFGNCTNLKNVVIPNSVKTIGMEAFNECRELISVTIPSSVTSIGTNAFTGCVVLNSIYFDGVPVIGSHVFDGGSSERKYYCPPENTDSFKGIQMTPLQPKAVFVDSLQNGKIVASTALGMPGETISLNISPDAGYKLQDGSLGYNDGSIFHNSITGTSFIMPDKDITIHGMFESALLSDNYAYVITGAAMCTITRYTGPGGYVTIPCSLEGYTVTAIGDEAFADCSSLIGITIPNSVTSIGVGAFRECTELTDITIPDSVVSIGMDAFSNCNKLTDVTIPNGVTSIGDSAFYRCSSLIGITIPRSVASVGNDVFAKCSALTGIIVDKANTNYSSLDGVLYDADKSDLICCPAGFPDSTFNVPEGVTSIGEEAFAGCKKLTGVNMPDSVISVGDAAFRGCSKLEGVAISDSVRSIGKFAFDKCEALKSVTIPSGVTAIDEYTFLDCRALSNVTIPYGVIDIGQSAFYKCNFLKNVIIPNSVKSVGFSAFHACSSMESITIPKSVESIGEDAFDGCIALMNIYFDGLPAIGSYSFTGDLSVMNFFCPLGNQEDVHFKGLKITPLGTKTVSVDSSMSNGTVEPSTASGMPGESISLNIKADTGWRLQAGSLKYNDGKSFKDIVESSFTMPGDNVTIHAVFERFDNINPTVCVTSPSGISVPVSSSGIVLGFSETVTGAANKKVNISDGNDIYTYTIGTDDNYISGTGAGCSATIPVSRFLNGTQQLALQYNTSYTVAVEAGAYIDSAGNGIGPGNIGSFRTEMVPVATVTVSANPPAGGSVGGGGTYSKDATVTVTASPKKGYSFVSWNEGDSVVSTNASYTFTMGTADRILKANFTANPITIYTVTFKDWNGKVLKAESVEAGKSATAPENPTREGYTFTGWDKAFSKVTSDLTVTAQYSINTNTVSFNVNGGSAVESQTVNYNEKAVKPADPMKEGCTFAGWYSEELLTTEFDFNIAIKVDTVIYAKWTVQTPVDTKVDIAAIPGVTIPEKGTVPVAAIAETTQYTGTVLWNPAHNPFAANTVYTATITLIPKAGYTLNGVEDNFFTVAGAASVSNTTGSGVITAVFPATDAEPPVTYTVTFSDWDGKVLKSQTVEAGKSATAPENPTRAGYTFTSWDKTFSNVTVNITVTARYSKNSSGEGDSGGTTPTATPPADIPKTDSSVSGNTITAAASSADSSGRSFAAVTQGQVSIAVKKAVEEAAKQGAGAATTVEIKVTAPAGAKTVELSIPKTAVSELADSNKVGLSVSTSIAVITFGKEALDSISQTADGEVRITASLTDTAALPEETRQLVGDRPVFNFSVTSGSRTISRFGGNVSVSVPYTPKPGEDANAIVIYYINAEGKLEIVSNCAYDPVTGTISFITNHFSKYAVGYNKVSFKDVPENSWYSKAVGFIAARGITTGIGNGTYGPEAKLTRGECLVMMMNAIGMEPDAAPGDNFIDAGDTYYTCYLAAAKRLGITTGTGSNRFAPGKEITRQEMFMLLYKALKLMGKLPEGISKNRLSDFNDAEQVAFWAKDTMKLLVETGMIGGSSGNLSPADTTTRAEIAQMLYKLLVNRLIRCPAV